VPSRRSLGTPLPRNWTILRPACGRNRHLFGAVHGGDLNLVAQRGLRHVDRHFEDNIVFMPLEEFVRLDVQHDVEIAGGPCRCPGSPSPFSRICIPSSTPGGTETVRWPRFVDDALPAADLAGRIDDFTRTPAARAVAHIDHAAQEGLPHLAHLPGAVAVRTAVGRGPGAAPVLCRCRRCRGV